MRLRQLEYFAAICDQGSFTGAAQALFVAQPSLSQQIRELERELGTALLERSHHGVSLTPAGRAFLPHARAAVEAAEAGRREVSRVIDGVAGEIKVLTVGSVAANVLPSGLARWREQSPSTVLSLHDFTHRRDLEAAMRAGRGDVAVGPRPADWDGDVVSLGFEELVVVGKGPFDRDAVDGRTLEAADWIHFEAEQGMGDVVDWATWSLGITPRVVVRVGQVAAALGLAVEGVGLTIVPANAVPLGWSGNVRSPQPRLYRELVAYTRGAASASARGFIETLTSVDLPIAARAELPLGSLTL